MGCEGNCKWDAELAAMRTEIGQLKEEAKRNQEAHRAYYDRLERMATSDASLSGRVDQICAAVSEIKADVKALKEKPARRWETLANAALQWLVVGLLAASSLLK